MTPNHSQTDACAASGYRADCPKRAFEFPILNATCGIGTIAHAFAGEQSIEAMQKAFTVWVLDAGLLLIQCFEGGEKGPKPDFEPLAERFG
jgi:hypothetical protein